MIAHLNIIVTQPLADCRYQKYVYPNSIVDQSELPDTCGGQHMTMRNHSNRPAEEKPRPWLCLSFTTLC